MLLRCMHFVSDLAPYMDFTDMLFAYDLETDEDLWDAQGVGKKVTVA